MLLYGPNSSKLSPRGDSVGLTRLGRHQDERFRFWMRLKQTLAFCFQSS